MKVLIIEGESVNGRKSTKNLFLIHSVQIYVPNTESAFYHIIQMQQYREFTCMRCVNRSYTARLLLSLYTYSTLVHSILDNIFPISFSFMWTFKLLIYLSTLASLASIVKLKKINKVVS